MIRKILKYSAFAVALPLLVGCSPSRIETAHYIKDHEIASLRDQIAEKNQQLFLAERNLLKYQAANQEYRNAHENQVIKTNMEIKALKEKIASLVGELKNRPKAAPPVVHINPTNTYTPELPAPAAVVAPKKDKAVFRLTVAGSMLFSPGKATLRSGAESQLRKVAAQLRSRYPGHPIRIEGHTDGDPIRRSKWKSNMQLSVARANAVYNYLKRFGGLPADKMHVTGFGNRQPLVFPEITKADKSKNRRVDIVVLPKNIRVVKQASATTMR